MEHSRQLSTHVPDAVDDDKVNAKALEVQAEWMRLVTFVVAMIGLALGISAAELRGNPLTAQDAATVYTDTLKALSSAFTAFLLVLVTRKYILKYRLLVERGQLLKGGEHFWGSGLLWPMLLELLVCAVHCPVEVYWRFRVPNLGVELLYDMDAILSIFMCLRLYLLIGVVDDYMGFRSAQARVVQSVHKLRFQWVFTFKAGLELYPTATLGSLFIGTTLVLAYCLRVTERPVCYTPEALAAGWCGPNTLGTKNFEQYTVAVWHVLITTTTIGYGDVFAVTHAGRGITVISGLFGIVVLALMVNSIGKAVQLADHEKNALGALLKQQLSIERRALAAGLVFAFLRFAVYRHKLKAAAHKNGSWRSRVSLSTSSTGASPAGAVTVSNPLKLQRRATMAKGAFESELLHVSRQSSDPGRNRILRAAISTVLAAVPVHVVRALVLALKRWRKHRVVWTAQTRAVSPMDFLARDVGEVKAELADVQQRLEGLQEVTEKVLRATETQTGHADVPSALTAHLHSLSRVVVGLAEQLNAIAHAQGLGGVDGCVRPVPAVVAIPAPAAQGAGVGLAGGMGHVRPWQPSHPQASQGRLSWHAFSGSGAGSPIQGGLASPGGSSTGHVHIGGNALYKNRMMTSLLGLQRADLIVQQGLKGWSVGMHGWCWDG